MNQSLYIASDLTLSTAQTSPVRRALAHPLLWTFFVIYVVVLGYTVAHHEPWGDEIHSWNIAKASGSYIDLIQNSRYEGHPPAWYTVLWTVSKFTHNFTYVQVVHMIIATFVVFAILFFSPFPMFVRLLIPFGYYFLYEFAVLSRNYALGVLAAVCICLIMRRSFRFKMPLYYFLLLVMSNVHLLAMVLAGCLHLYFLLFTIEQKGKWQAALIHVLLGALIFLPGIYFISPPKDSQLNLDFWVGRWSPVNIKASGQAPIRSMLPVPMWWKFSSWNTNFLLDGKTKSIIGNFFIVLALLTGTFFVFRKSRKALIVFGANFLLSMLIAVFVFPLASARYSGYIFIGFIMALWLFSYEAQLSRTGKYVVSILLGVQMIASLISVTKDIRFAFSNNYRVNELIGMVPPGEKMVTDYWAVNVISTYTDRPFYCIDIQKEISFVQWATDLANMSKKAYRYTDGVQNYFQKNGVDRLYMISSGSPAQLQDVDAQLAKVYRFEVVYKIEGAIEKGGNIYLYKISSR